MPPVTRRTFLSNSGLVLVGIALPGVLDAQPPRSSAFRPPNNALESIAATTATPTAFELQTPNQVLQMDVAASTWNSRFGQLVNQGYRNIWVQGSTNGTGAATYSAIWIHDGRTGWYEWQDMDAATYQTKFTDYAAAGYRPISVSGYQNNGVNQFAAIWLYDPHVSYYGIHNANNSQYQTFVNDRSAANYMPQVVDGYAVGTSPSASDDYISIWANTPSHSWVARHGMTSAQYQSNFTNYELLGYRVICLSAYQINGTTYFAAYWINDGITGFVGNHDWLPSDLFNNAITQEHNDYQPIVIEGYDTGSTRNFAAVWVKKARAWTTTGTYNPDLASFDSAMQTFMQTRNIPAGALAVTKGSRLVYARGYHWDGYGTDTVNPDSLFRIASLTKPLTSMAIMRLVQEGKIRLTDLLMTLLAGRLPLPMDSRMYNITVLNLLQHAGGWDRDLTFDPMFQDLMIAAYYGKSLPILQQDIMNYMTATQNLVFTPGTKMNYSNYGYMLLGRVIEVVTSVPYATYMQTKVFGPLGISRIVLGNSEFEYRKNNEVTYFATDPNLYPNMRRAGAPTNVMAPYGNFNIENMDSHGGWLASAVDLARFATAFDPTGFYPVLTHATINQVFAQPSFGINLDGSWYGCGWAVRTAGNGLNTWHNGSLTGTSTLMVRRYDGLDWVVLFNQRDDPNDPTGTTYGDIDPALHSAANAVTNWPAGDLFPNYGLPSRSLHTEYLPLIRR